MSRTTRNKKLKIDSRNDTDSPAITANKPGLMDSSVVFLIIIAVTGLLCYSNTFHAPFQWDESGYVEDNPVIKDLSYFLAPSKAKGHELYGTIKNRHIGFLTFALNYRLHGFQVTGYHLVNISIHIINSLLVYLLVLLTFRTPFLSGTALFARSRLIAFFSALFFVSHPIQTEAVTYVFQRLASLMTMFYLLSLICYIKFRMPKTAGLNSSNRLIEGPVSWLLGSVLFAVLAMKTKENAFTLPFAIAMYELFFFDGPVKKRIAYLAPVLLTLLIIPLTLTGIDRPARDMAGGFADAARGFRDISRSDYLFTQFRVITTYIRLLFLPAGQNVYYDYPLSRSFFEPQAFLSFLFLLSICCFSVYLFLRSRTARRELRLISFGISWFFVTLSVESSIVPLPMIICEYRAYLPSFGVFTAVTVAAFMLMQRARSSKSALFTVSSLTLISVLFSWAAYSRNALWANETALWEDSAAKSPGNARVRYNLAFSFTNAGNQDKAIEQYLEALRLKPDYVDAHNNLALLYNSRGLTDKAVEHLEVAIKSNPTVAGIHVNLGKEYSSKGWTDKAIEQYRLAMKLKPGSADTHNLLGNSLRLKGSTDEAIWHFQKAIELKPDFADAYNNLGVAYGVKGLPDKAIECLKTSLRLRPGDADSHFNLAIAYFKKNLIAETKKELEKALQINPGFEQASKFLSNLSSPSKIRFH